MTVDPAKLPYRQGVGLCLFNTRGLVLVAERRDRRGAWQMPQGGVHKDEMPHTAALRELKEEIGTNNAMILGRLPDKLRYEFPDWLQYKGGVFRGKYRGQEQTWFALLFKGTDHDIDLSGADEPEEPEFVDWKWVTLSETPRLVVDFKKEVYQHMAAGFKSYGEAVVRGDPLIPWQSNT